MASDVLPESSRRGRGALCASVQMFLGWHRPEKSAGVSCGVPGRWSRAALDRGCSAGFRVEDRGLGTLPGLWVASEPGMAGAVSVTHDCRA